LIGRQFANTTLITTKIRNEKNGNPNSVALQPIQGQFNFTTADNNNNKNIKKITLGSKIMRYLCFDRMLCGSQI
jgi:hypothetical protein